MKPFSLQKNKPKTPKIGRTTRQKQHRAEKTKVFRRVRKVVVSEEEDVVEGEVGAVNAEFREGSSPQASDRAVIVDKGEKSEEVVCESMRNSYKSNLVFASAKRDDRKNPRDDAKASSQSPKIVPRDNPLRENPRDDAKASGPSPKIVPRDNPLRENPRDDAKASGPSPKIVPPDNPLRENPRDDAKASVPSPKIVSRDNPLRENPRDDAKASGPSPKFRLADYATWSWTTRHWEAFSIFAAVGGQEIFMRITKTLHKKGITAAGGPPILRPDDYNWENFTEKDAEDVMLVYDDRQKATKIMSNFQLLCPRIGDSGFMEASIPSASMFQCDLKSSSPLFGAESTMLRTSTPLKTETRKMTLKKERLHDVIVIVSSSSSEVSETDVKSKGTKRLRKLKERHTNDGSKKKKMSHSLDWGGDDADYEPWVGAVDGDEDMDEMAETHRRVRAKRKELFGKQRHNDGGPKEKKVSCRSNWRDDAYGGESSCSEFDGDDEEETVKSKKKKIFHKKRRSNIDDDKVDAERWVGAVDGDEDMDEMAETHRRVRAKRKELFGKQRHNDGGPKEKKVSCRSNWRDDAYGGESSCCSEFDGDDEEETVKSKKKKIFHKKRRSNIDDDKVDAESSRGDVDFDDDEEETLLNRRRRASNRISSSSSQEENLSDESDVSGDDHRTRMSYRSLLKAKYGSVDCDHPLLKNFVRWQLDGAGNIKNATDARNSATHVSRYVAYYNTKTKNRQSKTGIVKGLENKDSVIKCFADYATIEKFLFSLKNSGGSSSTALNHLLSVKRFMRFLNRYFFKVFNECDDRYASWLDRSKNALADTQKVLSKSKRKEGVTKTTAESLCAEGKFGDPAAAISATKEALQARLIDYQDIIDKAKNKGSVSHSEIRFAFSFAYTWFLFNCPVTPPRQQSMLEMTLDDWEEVKRTKMLISKNFKTSATYGTEALPFEEDVIALFNDLIDHVRPLTMPKVNTVFLSVNGQSIGGGLSKLLQNFMSENVPEMSNINITNVRRIISTLSHETLGEKDRRNLAECNSHSLETEQKYYVRIPLAKKAAIAAQAKKMFSGSPMKYQSDRGEKRALDPAMNASEKGGEVDSPGDLPPTEPLAISDAIYRRIREECLSELRAEQKRATAVSQEKGSDTAVQEKKISKPKSSTATTAKRQDTSPDRVMMSKPIGQRTQWTREEVEEVYTFRKQNPSLGFSNLYSKIIASARLRRIFHQSHITTQKLQDCYRCIKSGSYVKKYKIGPPQYFLSDD